MKKTITSKKYTIGPFELCSNETYNKLKDEDDWVLGEWLFKGEWHYRDVKYIEISDSWAIASTDPNIECIYCDPPQRIACINRNSI